MSDEHTDPELQEWIDPELEARVVAWVLGQASEFEGAELERILAEKPELAIFKRRIEAVHGLVRAASLPEGEPMRLSAEGRQKVLDTLGQKELPPLTQVVAMAPAKKRGGNPWSEFAGVAACLVVAVILLASIATPSFTGVQIKAEQTKILALKRQRELQERIEAEDREADQAAQPQQQAPHIANPVAQPGASLAALDALKKIAEQRLSQSQNLPDFGRNQMFADGTQAMAGATNLAPKAAATYAAPTIPANGFEDDQSTSEDVSGKNVAPSQQQVMRLRAGDLHIDAKDSFAPQAEPTGPELAADTGGSAFPPSLPASSARNGLASDSAGKPSEATGAGAQLPDRDVQPPAQGGGVEEVKRLFTEAKSNEQTGRYDQSYRDYDKILNLDPYNIAARKGQEEVNRDRDEYADQAYEETRAQSLWQLDNGWQMPVHKFETKGTENFVPVQTDVHHTEYINSKLNHIIIPKIEFRNASVGTAVELLKEKSRQLDTNETDPTRRGVNIALEGQAPPNAGPAVPAAAAGAADESQKITLSLNNVPLGEALKYIAELSQQKVRVDANGVQLVPLSVNTDELITKEYQVPPTFGEGIAKQGAGPSENGSGIKVTQFLESQGVQFPPGAGATYFPVTHRLIVHNTESNLELIDSTVENAAPPVAQEVSAQDQPYSTFSLHVSDVSFLLAQAALARGQLPDPESIRPEEFYNAFDYGDPSPVAGQQVACHIEQAVHPLVQQRNLVRIAVKIAASGRGAGQPLRLTVLLDTSGSMEREDRAASVRRAMQSLASLLGPQDSVTLIGFAREPRILAEAVPGDQAKRLADIVAHTPSDGGTNMEEALKSATQLALRHFDPKGQNRVVLLTDGAANLGDADPGQLSKLVESLRQRGVSFDACGVGANGLNDEILEALTRKGGGRYYFLNGPDDADQGFARKLAGAFRPAAEDVKMQVRFNPSRVGVYRLIGFEKQRLNQEDFRNNKVTAAQLASEEAAVALYEVQPLPEGEGELGEVFVRFRDPSNGRIVEQSWTIPYDSHAPALDKAPPSMQLATAASFVAEKLRGGDAAGAIDLNALEPVIAQVRANFPDQPRVRQFVDMFEQVRGMMPGTKAGNSR